MRAFGYVRLSKTTEEATSPQRQRAKIEALCKDRGWELLQTFEDIDESAFNGHKRPAYDHMLGRLGEAEAIVFWRPDRLARSVTDFSHLLDTCRSGASIWSPPTTRSTRPQRWARHSFN